MMQKEISEREWLGIPEEDEKPAELHAGSLSVQFLNGRLLNFAYAGETVLQEVYFALRDRNWNTIPYTIRAAETEEREDGFALTFHAQHTQAGFLYDWKGRICGDASGSITYEFTGKAGCDFMSNRIGFCILHPAECAGRPCEILHSDGSVEKGVFPERISPHQPFFDIAGIRYEKDAGVRVSIEMTGDVFEMEDQRNWTDASFKTYCTPLALPFPVAVRTGDTVRQSVKVSLETAPSAKAEEAPEPERAEKVIDLIGGKEGSSLMLGTIIRKVPDEAQKELLKALGLSHVRCELRCAQDLSWFDEVAACMQELRIPIRLAVFFTENWEPELDDLCERIEKWREQILDMLIFMDRRKVISAQVLADIRRRLSGYGIRIGSGTDAFFTQNNREPLPEELLDMVVYSNNPQVHAFDNESIMLTTKGQMANVQSCRMLFPGKGIVVSPVTLKMRWNPDLTQEESLPAHTMPSCVDPRQISLFAASWTVRSIAALSEAGADSADYYEFTGSAGLMQEREGPDYAFPSWNGMIYPVYYSMMLLARMQCAKVRIWSGRRFSALLLTEDDGSRLIVANNTRDPLELKLNGLSGQAGMRINSDTVRMLAEGNSLFEENENRTSEMISKSVALKPYEVMCIYC